MASKRFAPQMEETELFVVASNFANTKQTTTVKDQSGVEHDIHMAMDFLGFKGGMWVGKPTTRPFSPI